MIATTERPLFFTHDAVRTIKQIQVNKVNLVN
jgi:hypothetical protein